MPSVKKCLFSLAGVLLVAGSLSFYAAPKASADVASGQKAVIFQPNSSTEYATSNFDQSVSNAIKDGANYIYLTIPIHEANIYANSMYASYNTPTDSALQTAVSYIHSQGAHVAFSLHDDMDDGNWRSYAAPTDRGMWFSNYQAMLDHYALDAQQDGVEEYVIGTEMTSMTDPSYNSGNTAAWDTMIASVRGMYGGKLTYSAQHNEYRSEVNTIQFWPKLDYIGISAYYSLGSNTSVSALMSSWAAVDSAYVQPIAAQYGKQVVFTEVGYESKTGSTADPGASYAHSGAVDLTGQANAYQALLQYWNAKSYWGGVAFWGWSSDPNAGGSNDTNYTPQNKPAEQVMKQWFTAGGTTTPTPPTPAANYTASLTGSTTVTANSSANYTYTVSATQTVSNALIDVEIYNASGQQVLQTYQTGQTVGSGGLSGNFVWTPATTGTYTVKLGVFTANWQQNLYWNNGLSTITVGATSTPPPVVTPPTPPTPTPPTPTPPTPTPPAANASVDIWWPSNGSSVSGVQPFKALIDGVADSQYTMYWQVDNGTLNLMSNATNPVDYKQSMVDLSGWNWQPSGQYVVNFVAKDLSGTVIATKSVTITVSH